MSVKVAPPSASGDGGAKRGDMYEALKRELESIISGSYNVGSRRSDGCTGIIVTRCLRCAVVPESSGPHVSVSRNGFEKYFPILKL